MDTKYYALVEIIAFAALALGFCAYQIWTVRRKPDDQKPRQTELASGPDEKTPK